MKIAIIGDGNVGSALGGSLVRAGHAVTFAARDAEGAHATAGRLGARAAATPAQAASGADVVVLAVPYDAAATIAGEVARVAPDAIIVDATNPIRSDGSGLATSGGPSGAERIAAATGGAAIVKAFNTLFASVQGDPSSVAPQADALIAGDDTTAKATAAALARSIGLRPIDAGPLAEAATLEAMAWLNISLQMRTGGDWHSTFVLTDAPRAAILEDVREPVSVS